MNLEGQVALVSGGLGHIGRAISCRLTELGAAVAVGDIWPSEQAAPLLQKLGRKARYDQVDVSDDLAVDRWLQAVEQSLGLPNLVIPSAAIVTMSSLRSLTPAEWRKELSINLDGAFFVAHAAAKRLIAAGRPGRIVFIGSWAASVPHAHVPTYCVAKAGLRMLMKQMALEYAPNGILVNEVAPGYVDGGLNNQAFVENTDLREQCRLKVPIRQLMTADDVAFSVAHLCDPRNRHMTGSVVLMDGGLSLK